MKGKTVRCLEQMVKVRHGREKWAQILVKAGRPPVAYFAPGQTVPPAEMLKLVEACASVLGMSLGQAIDALDEYWSLHYAPLFNGVSFERPGLSVALDPVSVRIAA